jgi:hypothetical protein
MAQNKNGPIYGLAIFMLLSVLLAVFWYLNAADLQLKDAQLAKAASDNQNLTGIVRVRDEQLNTLKRLIGKGESVEVGEGETTDPATVNGGVTKLLQDLAGDGTDAPLNLEAAVRSASSESQKNSFSATDRLAQVQKRSDDLANTIVSKDGEIKQIQTALNDAEKKLVEQEAKHSEELAQREEEIRGLRAKNIAIENEYEAYKVTAGIQIEDLNTDIRAKRQAIIELRKRLREQEDLSFSTPDGLVTTVDHNQNRCYIDLGSDDGLRTGVTFSVYKQDNSGVGRTNTTDIKGKIEIVSILGPHRAAARIVDQKPGQPIGEGDLIYSPIFQTGQALEIAVVGKISTDGLDRDQFRRLVSAAGARIVSEVDDMGDFGDGKGNNISREDAVGRITSRTRYIVIANQGDEDTQDAELQKLYKKIKDNSRDLREEALNQGIHEVGLSTFLEHIGYSRKQISWTPESGLPFPGKLPNGARSSAVNATFGNRQSSAVISGQYSERGAAPTISSGQTSKAYSN